METIVIQVSEYYNKPKYYGFMPEVMFNALESAFINGKETAEVPRAAFETMLKDIANENENR